MNSRICMCCGERMAEQGNVLSRNPNMCASCSSMADGMDELSATGYPHLAEGRRATPETAAESIDQPEALRCG